MKKQQYITRVNYKTGLGFWWVRFYRGTNNASKGLKMQIEYQHTFTDLNHGGEQEALQAAIIWRDLMAGLRDMPEGKRASFAKTKKLRVDNKTGVAGVNHIVKVKSNGGVCPAYVTTWSETQPDGTRPHCSKWFGYGAQRTKEQAFKLAKRHRRQMVAQHYG